MEGLHSTCASRGEFFSFAYILASWAMSLQVDMQVWETSPVFVRAQLDADKIGVSYPRGCAM